ncbi:hypothetical protein M422DRAFT_45271 [Sphaerobolus stellatus SS14]|nr:hypothetical protein M422DRAFT_45270 [Sphaerobolus stellatus SS14]KIJ48545.1 hypothetical protein M422DRAFT_45271 [Sphaerobolus stellatus SS14]
MLNKATSLAPRNTPAPSSTAKTATEVLATKSRISSKATALEFMEQQGFQAQTDEYDVLTLSNHLIALSVSTNLALIKNGIRAIGILMTDKALEATIKDITTGKEEAMGQAITMIGAAAEKISGMTAE